MPTLTPEMIAAIVKFITELVGQYQVARAAAALRAWYRLLASEHFRAACDVEHAKLSKAWADLALKQEPLRPDGEPG